MNFKKFLKEKIMIPCGLLPIYHKLKKLINHNKNTAVSSKYKIKEIDREKIKFVDINNKTYKLEGDDYLTVHVQDDFEPAMVYLFKSLIYKDDYVLDIGANIGCTGILFGDISEKVVCFEPNPSTFDFLQSNISNSGFKNIDIKNIGLGICKENMEITYSPNMRAEAFIADNKITPSNFEKAEIHIERLDDIINTLDIPRVDFIKLDVEGFEKKVLEGAKKTIKKFKPVCVLEMNHWCLNAFQRMSIPDFMDFLRSQFPILLAIEGKSYANLHDKNECFSVMHEHVVHFKYMNIVAAFNESSLKDFYKSYEHKLI